MVKRHKQPSVRLLVSSAIVSASETVRQTDAAAANHSGAPEEPNRSEGANTLDSRRATKGNAPNHHLPGIPAQLPLDEAA